METDLLPKTDTTLSSQGVASLIYLNAIVEISKLAGVSLNEASKLLIVEAQLDSQSALVNRNKTYISPVIEQPEHKFIFSLFN